MESEDSSIVIENGSTMIRYGLSGNDCPYKIPAVVGSPKHSQAAALMPNDYSFSFIGHEAISKRGVLDLKYPIQAGSVNDYDSMKLIWKNCYLNEHTNFKDTRQKTLLTESMCEDKAAREKTIQIFFEEFQVPGFFMQNRTKLGLYAVGKSTGIAVHSGDEVTQYVACLDGKIVDNGILDTFVAGKNITRYIRDYLSNEMKVDLHSSAEYEIIKAVKEKYCFLSKDHEMEKKGAEKADQKPIEYKLPDERIIKMNSQALMSPQIMFDPKIIGQDAYGIHQNIIDVASRVQDAGIRRLMLASIALAGGNTLFKNFRERLENEVKKKSEFHEVCRVLAPLQRQNLTWIGGSILTSLSKFKNEWITKAQYEEFGPNIIHQKCLF